MNQKHKQTRFINKPKEFFEIIMDKTLEKIDLRFINDDIVFVSTVSKDEYINNNFQTNIYIAAFTASYARLKLYNLLNELGEDVIADDTDSVWFVENERTKAIFEQYVGDSLGKMTDEYKGIL